MEQNQPAQATDLNAVRQKVEAALDHIRPAIEMDGGEVVLGDIVDGIAYVHMKGACHGCPSSTMTLRAGIERIILEQVPEIKGVEAV
jgi:Fe-S cluster biogenesis protein NfuA